MRIAALIAPALVLAGCASAPARIPASPGDAKAKVAPVEYRSAFEGYRAFADQELQDWRRANDEVGAAGGHMGHKPGQGAGQQTSKPQPGKPESSGGPAEHRSHQR
jgi:hypothetical protein